MWRGLLLFVWVLAFVCDVVCLCVVNGKLDVCCFVLSVICGVRCSVVCDCVCLCVNVFCCLMGVFGLFVVYCLMLSGLYF